MLWNVSEWEAYNFTIANLIITPPPTQGKTEAQFPDAKVIKD